MRKRFAFVLGACILLGAGVLAYAQFLPEDLAERAKWEEYLNTAKITAGVKMTGPDSVTNPWRVTMEKDGVKREALWKNIYGRPKGYIDSWKYEVAAYRMDKLLDLNMVPPTVERNYEGVGSLQLWVESWMTLKKKMDDKVKIPSYKVFYWNRALYLQRFFDNLIANEDRHQNNYLITKDWRMYLIDHSRSFRSSSKFTKELIYTEKHKERLEMKELPKVIVDKVKALTYESIKQAVGDYLDDDEIKAILVRRDLIFKEIEKLGKKYGADTVLY
jgi:hypothetical protein